MDEIQIDIGGVQIFQRFIEGSLNLVGLVEGVPKLSGGISSDENGSRKRSQFTICAQFTLVVMKISSRLMTPSSIFALMPFPTLTSFRYMNAVSI